MANGQKKSERLQTLYETDKLLNDYCKHCPFLNSQRNCGSCPVEGLMREHRKSLGWEDERLKPWSFAEDAALIRDYKTVTTANIAKMMDRTTGSVYARTFYLRKKGLL